MKKSWLIYKAVCIFDLALIAFVIIADLYAAFIAQTMRMNVPTLLLIVAMGATCIVSDMVTIKMLSKYKHNQDINGSLYVTMIVFYILLCVTFVFFSYSEYAVMSQLSVMSQDGAIAGTYKTTLLLALAIMAVLCLTTLIKIVFNFILFNAARKKSLVHLEAVVDTIGNDL